MFSSLGMPELILILVIALVVFGPKQLPEIGKTLGRTLNEFRRYSINGLAEAAEEAKEVKDTSQQPKEVKEDSPQQPAAAVGERPMEKQNGSPEYF